MAVQIEWKDGTVDTAPNLEVLLEVITFTQWQPYSPAEMKHVLSDRAWLMGQKVLDPELALPDFFSKMQELDMIKILQWEIEDPNALGATKPDSYRPTARQRREREAEAELTKLLSLPTFD